MTRFRPSPVSRAQAAFNSAFAVAASAVDLAIAGRAARLVWAPRVTPFEPMVGLDLAFDGMAALLLLDSDPTASLLDLPITADELAVLPPSLQASLVTHAIDDLIHQVTARMGLSPEVRALLSAERIADAPLPSAPEAVGLGWRIDEEGRTWLHGALWLSAALARRVVDLMAGPPTPGRGVAVDRLRLPLRVELGRTGLTAGELGGLEPDDVVLVQEHRWDEGRVTVIVAANLRYAARVADGQLTVGAREETEPLSDDADDQTDEVALADLDDVTVSVAFDLGRLELAIGELRRVAEGYVFDLERPLDRAVALRVGGRLIGRGELVEIEGSLGVRVIEIFPRDHG
jgi:type III secretion system YscQ/HrcQ family protein